MYFCRVNWLVSSVFWTVLCASTAVAQVADPVLSVGAGTSAANVTVTVTETSPGALVFYTTDNSTPTTSSTAVPANNQVLVNVGTTLKAAAFLGTATSSNVVSGIYTSNGFLTASGQHSVLLKPDGTIQAWGANGAGQLGIGSVSTPLLPNSVPLAGANPITGVTMSTQQTENGLPLSWEIANFGQTGLNPNTLAPNGSGLTILQSYQQGIDPREKAPVEPFAINVACSGPFQAPCSPVIVASVTHPTTTTITRVDFSDNGTVINSDTTAPYQYTASYAAGGNHTITATAYDSTGASASAQTTLQISDSNFYNRGFSGSTDAFYSSIVALDFQKGIILDDGFGGVNGDFTPLYPTSQYPIYPWFLRIQGDSNELWKQIIGITNGTPTYKTYNHLPVSGGSTVGGAPPLVAFGSQGGGTSLYVNQAYHFGVAAGGQTAPTTANPNPTDIEIEVYSKASVTGGGVRVAPVYTQTISLPRYSPTSTAWATFIANGFVQDYHLVQAVSGVGTIDFDTQVQYLPNFTGATQDIWYQSVNYAMQVTHKAANSLFYYRVRYKGVTTAQSTIIANPLQSDVAMAVDSTGMNQVYNIDYTLDFDDPSPWQSAYISAPHFQETPLPSAYQGKTLDELIHNAPAVSDTLSTPDMSGKLNGLDILHVDNSPELRDHPVLDQLVTNLGNDPMAIANYVLNEIDLTDAVGYDTQTGKIADSSINPQGVSRDALAVYLEGQGSPTEECALLVYLLRQCKTSTQPNGIPCGYVFPQQDGLLMFDEQLSKLLHMQIRGANNPAGGIGIPELIPVNYPWVAAYINGKWIHLFPWLKDTAVEEGQDLWGNLPSSSTTSGQTFGYQTGKQWALHYILNDPNIRGLTTPDGQITDDVAQLFPFFVQNQLKGTAVSMDQLGIDYYNRRNYYTNWQDFPRPWTVPAVSNSNVASNLDVTQQASAFSSILTNIFDTLSVQVVSDRNGNGTAVERVLVRVRGTVRLQGQDHVVGGVCA